MDLSKSPSHGNMGWKQDGSGMGGTYSKEVTASFYLKFTLISSYFSRSLLQLFVDFNCVVVDKAVCCRRSPCKFSGLTCFGLTSLFSRGPGRSIKSQQDSNEHWLERE